LRAANSSLVKAKLNDTLKDKDVVEAKNRLFLSEKKVKDSNE
jgi:hypothetical protein